MARDEATLLDSAKAARLIALFVQATLRADSLQDLKTQSAVQHQLLVIGEAIKRLSRDFRDQHSMVPWSLMAGMRDHLVHRYDAVDMNEVWQTATRDIPALLAQLQALLPSQDGAVEPARDSSPV